MLIQNDLKYAKTNYRVIFLANVFVSVLVIITLAAFAASDIFTYFTKARVSEALSKFSVAREKVMVDYSYFGYFPKQKVLQKDEESQFDLVDKVTFDGVGTIDFLFSNNSPELSGKILSFVASRSTSKFSDNIIWNCGFAEPVKGFIPIGKNKTSVEKKYLPESCR